MYAIRAVSARLHQSGAREQLARVATHSYHPLTPKTSYVAQRNFNVLPATPCLPSSIRPERMKMLTRDDYALFFNGDKVLKDKRKDSFIIPCSGVYKSHDPLPSERDFFYIGKYDDKKVFGTSYNLPEGEDGFILAPTRDALAMTDVKTSQLICRAKHLLNWHRSSLYSGCCGVQTVLSPNEIAKICESCKKTIYPTSSSFVIVLIEKEGKLLLARSPHFAKGMYSTLAGFVDAGESYEDAVHREVEEEVGIKVKDLTYFGSQSWPFPSSIAVAFRAKYNSGEIQIDPKEIEDAQWFDPKKLPPLPHPCSISRHIIDAHTKI